MATVATVFGVAAGAVGGFLFFTSRPARAGEPPARARVGIGSRMDGAEIGVGGSF